jgi:hypothetical protein
MTSTVDMHPLSSMQGGGGGALNFKSGTDVHRRVSTSEQFRADRGNPNRVNSSRLDGEVVGFTNPRRGDTAITRYGNDTSNAAVDVDFEFGHSSATVHWKGYYY